MKPLFTGCATALVTPFRDGQVDYDALDRLVEAQLAGGVSALVAAGTTGGTRDHDLGGAGVRSSATW